MFVTTPRPVLRPFTDMDPAPFHALNTHPLVAESLGRSPTRAESDRMVDAVGEEVPAEGFGFWALEVTDGPAFAGMVGLDEIVSFTTTVNARSQAVMVRIGMRRDPDGDFDHPALPEGSPLRRRLLYRIGPSQLPPTVAA